MGLLDSIKLTFTGYDSHGFDKDGFDKEGYDRDGFNHDGYDRDGYDRDGFNSYGWTKDGFFKNGTKFNDKGYDVNGFDRNGWSEHGLNVNGTLFDDNGYNKEGYDQFGYNKDGYDQFGYDKYGFNIDGYNRDGFNKAGWNARGQNVNGTYFDDSGYSMDGYDQRGYDIEGYNRKGFNEKGWNRQGLSTNGTVYDDDGFDINGYSIDGYDRAGFNKSGIDRDGFNRNGYGSDGYDRDGFNAVGIDRNGFNKSGWNKDGLNKNGTIYDESGYTVDGFDKEGYNRNGINKKGFNRAGWNRDGLNINGTRFDAEGFDIHGYDKDGYDHDGFNRNGRDRDGYNRNGYNKAGFNREGFNKSGWNKLGLNINGTKYDEAGFDYDGYDKEGYNKQGIDRNGFNKSGWNSYGDNINGTRYDSEGFDFDGYNSEGIDRNGYDKAGFNQEGWNREGLNRNGTKYSTEGYDIDGFDKQGFNRLGLNRNGLTKQQVKAREKETKRQAKIERIHKESARFSAVQHDPLDIPENNECKNALSYFTQNPYRVLGIPANSDEDQVFNTYEKLKKLDRLKVLSSYKTAFSLSDFPSGKLDLPGIQNAMNSLKNKKYKWFWFNDGEILKAWRDPTVLAEFAKDGMQYAMYDLLLINYLSAIYYDPGFEHQENWKPVFQGYCHFIKTLNMGELLSRFSQEELKELDNKKIKASFKVEFIKPITTLISLKDCTANLHLYKLLDSEAYDQLSEIKKNCVSNVISWFTEKEENLENQVDSTEDILDRELRKIKVQYEKEIKTCLTLAKKIFKGDNVRISILQEIYIKGLWKIMFSFSKYAEKDAISIANDIYAYCDDERKRKLRVNFGYRNIKNSERDITDTEWDIMGDNYMTGSNGFDQNEFDAVTCYRHGADAGNMYSMNSLGICYQNGKGTIKSEDIAADWFEKASDAGNPDGYVNLALCYIKGEGRERDMHHGIDLLIQAAKMGHPRAGEMAKKVLDLWQEELKQSEHESYDLGYQSTYGKMVIVEIELNYSANCYLVDDDNYDNYNNHDRFSYYGGRATQSPYRIKIPHSGIWHLIIDNGEDGMDGIITSVHTRTLNL